MLNKFYPSLSTVVSVDVLPESLNFITESVNGLLEKIYFKDLIIEKSSDGCSYTYKLDFVSHSEILKLEIPGTGLVLKLNPDLEDPNNDVSVIPISLNFNWGILQLVKYFKINNFSFKAEAFHELILQITTLDDFRLLSFAIETFIDATDQVGQFTIDANGKYPELNLTYPPDPDFDIAVLNILAAFQQNLDISLYEG